MAEETLRESIEKAFVDNAEPPNGQEANNTGGEGAGASNEPPGSSTQESAAGDQPSGQGGEGSPPGDSTDSANAQQQLDQGAPGAQPPDGQAGQPAQQGAQGPTEGQGLKAPQSWRPEVREHWSKLPADVQQEITRRETQVMRALNDAAQYVNHYNQFQQICAPYASMIAMEGNNPMVAFQDYLKTAATLRIGAPQEKANALANVVMQFGVDLEQLDSALAARVSGKQQPAGPQQQFQDPRVDQLLGEMKMRQQANEEAVSRSQQAEIDAFTADPKNEFFNDVRGEVADILELYANRGVRCTLKEAYDKACMLHPSISKIVSARNQAAATAGLVKNNSAAIEAKRRAALMPPGSPNIGPGDTNGNMSLRDTIAAAMTQAESRV